MNYYQCMDCNVKGVKLWRIAACSRIEIRCVGCAEKYAKGTFNRLWDYSRNRFFDGDQMYFGHTNLVPAIPDPLPEESGLLPDDVDWWGYTSVPQAGVVWWKRLPMEGGGEPVPYNWESAYLEMEEFSEFHKRQADAGWEKVYELRHRLESLGVAVEY